MNKDSASEAKTLMTEVLEDLDTLLLTAPTGGFLLGRWIQNARALVPSNATNYSADADLLEMNARAQVTSWEPVVDANAKTIPGLYDYGNKAWSGLVGPYYLSWYSLYADAIAGAASAGKKKVDRSA